MRKGHRSSGGRSAVSDAFQSAATLRRLLAFLGAKPEQLAEFDRGWLPWRRLHL